MLYCLVACGDEFSLSGLVKSYLFRILGEGRTRAVKVHVIEVINVNNIQLRRPLLFMVYI